MNDLLFSYGTLQKTNVQLQLFGRLLQGSSDVLEGYTVCTIEIRDEIFLSKGQDSYQQTVLASNNPNDSIQGTAFEIREEELLLSDQYEPSNYKRMKVKLRSGRQAWIYLASTDSCF